ncbi:MAG: deoxyguanosinetriphosphate triphosphohydrolase [Alphaproteobacteria bacterium]|nr:deoxyguanosinetriphosphate triphosphohydrolase [Alphaproteobacteria bacterium]
MSPVPPPHGPPLAPYATRPERSRGRLHPEPESATRSVFQRDRDRIIHCGAFRRLKHKTQVFVYHEGDYYRTRLTHSLEVAQIARSICRALDLNEDLGEALALAHDLGHPPFGHAGEDALGEAMRDFGGFDHNAQTLKVLTGLEQRYAAFDGLNLTWECLEGVVKHNGPLTGPHAGARGAQPLPEAIARYGTVQDLELDSFAGPEAQVAALSDDIAYNNHDIDDGLRAGLFTVDDLRSVPLVGEIIARVQREHPDIEGQRLIYETVRRLINHMVNDLLAETQARLAAAAPASVEEIRALDQPVVGFSEDMLAYDRAMRAFLFERMYRHPRVNRMAKRAREVVTRLFAVYMSDPATLPAEWREQTRGHDERATARIVADYIAGMTDRYAFQEYDRLGQADARNR